MFEENLDHCKLTDDKKEIETANYKLQLPTNLITLCQTSIKDGIEELLMGTIEDKNNFSAIKKMIVFSENIRMIYRDFIITKECFYLVNRIFGEDNHLYHSTS